MEIRGIIAKTVMLAAAGLIAAGTSASAAETFSLTGANTNTSNTIGNVRTFTGNAGTKLEVSAFTLSGSSVAKSFVGQYSPYGLGVLGTNDSSHTVDNNGAIDFLLLQFDKAVTVSSLGIYGFGDTDLTYGVGTTATPFNSVLSIANKTALNALFSSYIASAGNTSNSLVARAVNGGKLSGNVFLVAASMTAGTNDSFKLNSVTATVTPPAVPEPASWAMMIAGFSLVGAGLRSRATRATVRFA